MKSIIDYIEDIEEVQLKTKEFITRLSDSQNKQIRNIADISVKQTEMSQRMGDLELQQSQVIVNQEYANCLLELN